jgi:protein TonB
MFLNSARYFAWLLLLSIGLCVASARGQQEVRKIVANPAPVYPEMARRMQLSGVVKIEVVVAPDGKIKDSKVIGGHPVLVDAAMTALHDWRYEKGNSETKTQVEFKFHF